MRFDLLAMDALRPRRRQVTEKVDARPTGPPKRRSSSATVSGPGVPVSRTSAYAPTHATFRNTCDVALLGISPNPADRLTEKLGRSGTVGGFRN
jgi:hypothetical protein